MKKLFFAYLSVCIVFLPLSCSKENVTNSSALVADSADQLKAGKPATFAIKKGAHYCKPDPLSFTSKSKLIFTALFDSSCMYTTQDAANQNDINKLYGFSDCGDHHLDNSARVGWRWSRDSLRLFGFVHLEGEMLMQEITTAKIGVAISCSIECLPAVYIFTVNGKSVQMPRSCSSNSSRYKLNPYFGGDETAPHDISIQITEQP